MSPYTHRQSMLLRPDFIVAGTMKSGTTALYEYLCSHPKVIPRRPKELHFFNNRYDEGLDVYRSFFVQRLDEAENAGKLIGEASPGYVSPYAPGCAQRVRDFVPEVRLIVALRDPAERAISHYHHKRLRMGIEQRSLEAAFSEEEVFGTRGGSQDYLLHGRYLDCLAPWLAAFPREQILVLDFHDLEARPQALLDQMFTFLGLARDPSIQARKVYANEYDAPAAEVVERLRQYYEQPNRQLVEALGAQFDFNARR